MQTRYSPGQAEYSTFSTERLRAALLVDSLFQPGRLELVYSDSDRAIVGSVVPLAQPLCLSADAELRAAFFCERRELGVLNIGGPGVVTVDSRKIDMVSLDCLYVGRGSRAISFASGDAANPALFYLLSYPAHAVYPTALCRPQDANKLALGTVSDANRRTIHQCIHPRGIQSCQLVMGYTRLHDGSVWNTMPPHTHTRRSEVYMYFDLGSDRRVFHLMGTPDETRHLVVADRQVVLSPSWSLHSGCGTGAYSFCWGMGGENQAFDDMDPVPMSALK
jgi:4-deoxy-L-threo-5-hexosulose-uronate ketol-isomerase